MMYAIVELMGHRSRAGMISDAQMGGATLLRIEHPSRTDHTGNEPLCEYYAPAALFSIRPCSKEEAERYASWAWPTPAKELQPALAPELADYLDDDDEEDSEGFTEVGYFGEDDEEAIR